MCYVRPGLLHCCETLELTVADEATLHRIERCIIYIYYTCIYHILSYTEYIQDINQSHMRFETNTLGFMFWHLLNWASKLDTRTIYNVNVYTRSHIKEHKVVPEWGQLSRSEPHLIYFHSCTTLFNFNLLPSSVASLTFSLRVIMNCDQAEYY